MDSHGYSGSVRIAALLLVLAAPVAADVPPSGQQIWPWPIGGRLTRAHVDPEGFAWVGNNGGDVLRIDPARVPHPDAYRMFHLAHGFEVRAIGGLGGRLWAVGHIEGAGGAIYEFDGKRWRGVYVTAQGFANRFHSILVLAANDIWVVGTGQGTKPASVRYDGKRWHELDPGEARYLSGIARLSDGQLWSGGVSECLHRWDGKRWVVGRRVAIPYLWGLYPCGDRLFLQGTDKSNTHGVWDVTEPKARRIRVPGNDDDLSIAGVVGDALYCVDDNRRLWRITRDGTFLVAENAVGSVTGLPDGRLLLTGSGGFLETLDGNERLPCGYRGDFTAFGASPDGKQCVAATKKGPFVTFDGRRIRLIPRPHRYETVRVTMRSTSEIYAAIASGHVYRYDGKLWTRITREALTETYKGTNHGRIDQPVRFDLLYLPKKGGLVVVPSMDCWDAKGWRRLELPFDPYKPKRYVETGAVITHVPEYPGVAAVGGESIAELMIDTSEGFFLREKGNWIKLDPRSTFQRRVYAPGEKPYSKIRLTMTGLRR